MLVPQLLMAATHQIAMNVRTVLSLNDGDDVELVGFPDYNWGYTRVFMGVNAGPFAELTGGFFVNDCGYDLSGFYTQFDFRYSSSIRMTYFGPSADLPIQWWLGTGAPEATCVKSEDTPEAEEVKNLIKILVSEKFKNYNDIGNQNASYVFEGVSKPLKITNMPSGDFNVIKFTIVPLDKKSLDGYMYFGDKKYKVNGDTTIISLAPRYKEILPFELSFDTYRKVKIKWQAIVDVPEVTDIADQIKNNGDSVSVEYSFEKTPYTHKSLKINFDKNAFTDGKAPTVKKYAFNPNGPADEIGMSFSGTLYDISANLKPGKRVTMALPLDMDYDSEEDTLWFEHFIEEENTWVKVPVDSIVDGYAYFTVDHFCFGWLKKACKTIVKYTVKIGAGVLNVIPGVRKYVDKLANYLADAVGSAIDGIINTYEWIREVLTDIICFDWESASEKIAEKFTDAATYLVETFIKTNSGWDLPDGFVNFQNWDAGLQNKLEAYRNLDFVGTDENSINIILSNENIEKVIDDDQTCKDIADADDRISCLKWRITKYNYDIYLADILLTQANIGTTRFKFEYDSKTLSGTVTDHYRKDASNNDVKYPLSLLFNTDPGFLNDASSFVDGLQACGHLEKGLFPFLTTRSQMADKIRDLNFRGACKDLFNMFSLENIDVIGNTYDCGTAALKAKAMLTSHEKKLIAVSEAMTRASLLAWVDKNNFRPYSALMLKNVYDGSREWLSLIAPLMMNNNISTKAYVSLALYEFVHYGTQEMLAKLNHAFDINYGFNGGYSEGAGYSQYIWDEATYIFAAMKDAYASKSWTLNLSHNFMQSADHMFNTSRPVGALGNIPVEIDDGVTYKPDYRPWAKLKNDTKYLAMHQNYGMDNNKITTLVPFGVPNFTCNTNECSLANLQDRMGRDPYLWTYFEDGVGVISVKNPSTGEITSLSLIGESGNQFTLGQAHDQQDNLSITLTSSKDGPIIQDRGYAGFGQRPTVNFHRFIYHNVLAPLKDGVDLTDAAQKAIVENIVDIDAQSDNRSMEYSDIKNRYNAFMKEDAGYVYKAIFSFIDGSTIDAMSGGNIYNFRLEGGKAVKKVDKLVDIPTYDPTISNSTKNGYGAIAYTATLPYSKGSIEDDRTILYFGGSLWVIDQPNKTGMVWLANSPIAGWNSIADTYGVELFASSPSKIHEENLVVMNGSCIHQNGSVAPGVCDPKAELNNLTNYEYGLHDPLATTYVMQYNVMGSAFSKYTSDCPTETQCFMSTDGNVTRKVVVPAKNVKYDMCDALHNDCALPYETDAILIAIHLNGKWEYQLLNGKTYDKDNEGALIAIIGGTTSLTAYTAYRMDGSAFSGRYRNTYQPYIPLLLLKP